MSGERTKEVVIAKALEESISRRKQRGLLKLMGKLEWDADFDYKRERSRTEATPAKGCPAPGLGGPLGWLDGGDDWYYQ